MTSIVESIVELDGGHGGTDSGAVGNGLFEKNLTLAMAKRVRDILEKDYEGVKVKMTRTTDVYHTLTEKANIANRDNADFFVSFHVNAGGGTGYEDFIYEESATDGATDKARQKIHAAVVPVLKKYDIKDRGMKKANLGVLRQTKMKAVLVETLFIDDKDDAKLLKNSTFLEDMAQAYAKGIAEVVGAKRKPEPKPTIESISKKLYRVQVGAFGSKTNAESLAKELNKKGYNTTIKFE